MPRPPKRTCVEDCLCLWIHRMPRGKNILRWRQGEIEIASLEYERSQETVVFRAQTIAVRRQSVSVNAHILHLATGIPPDTSGQQWLRCECGRKFWKLFLPPGKADFRCRFCHNLTHHSAQIHNGYMAHKAKSPKHLVAAMQSSRQDRNSFAVKAILTDW